MRYQMTTRWKTDSRPYSTCLINILTKPEVKSVDRYREKNQLKPRLAARDLSIVYFRKYDQYRKLKRTY